MGASDLRNRQEMSESIYFSMLVRFNSMITGMFRLLHNFKIFNLIILSVMVNMMHVLFSGKFAIQNKFHYPSMNQPIFSLKTNKYIPASNPGGFFYKRCY